MKNKIDEDALADAYNRALELEKSGDIDAAVKEIKRVAGWEPKVNLDTILDRVIEYFRADRARV